MRWGLRLLALSLTGCGTAAGGGPQQIEVDCNDANKVAPGAACTYPEGAQEPMALGEVLSPYVWPRAVDASGAERELSLPKVHCNEDPAGDWSRFGFLLFVSIPAW